jgi:hypothetical protein
MIMLTSITAWSPDTCAKLAAIDRTSDNTIVPYSCLRKSATTKWWVLLKDEQLAWIFKWIIECHCKCRRMRFNNQGREVPAALQLTVFLDVGRLIHLYRLFIVRVFLAMLEL